MIGTSQGWQRLTTEERKGRLLAQYRLLAQKLGRPPTTRDWDNGRAENVPFVPKAHHAGLTVGGSWKGFIAAMGGRYVYPKRPKAQAQAQAETKQAYRAPYWFAIYPQAGGGWIVEETTAVCVWVERRRAP